jgi:hypothetical protein
MAPAETCDGADNDQDGEIDEDLGAFLYTVPSAQLTAALADCAPDSDPDSPACHAAIHRTCAASGCAASGVARVAVDEWTDSGALLCTGGATEVVSTTFNELSGWHADCNSYTRQSPACNAAIHRMCAARGQVTGFGPVENDGDTAIISCAPDAWIAETTYTALVALDSRCDGSLSRDGAGCAGAFHLLCQSLGARSGFGPLENSGDYALVACTGSL